MDELWKVHRDLVPAHDPAGQPEGRRALHLQGRQRTRQGRRSP